MLQDIGPAKFHNEYHRKEITPQGKVLCFWDREVLIARGSAGELWLPTYEELQGELSSCVRLQYLFSVDEEDFFLVITKDVVPQAGAFQYEKVRNLRQLVSKNVSFVVMTAYHLYVWYRDNRFCGRCGEETIHDTKERMLRCPGCGNMIFPKIAPAVIVAVTDGDRIVMTKYADREYKKYALIAGFTEIGETAEETVKREVMEEVGLRVKNIRYYKSQPWGVDSNLLLGFFAQLDGDDTIHRDETELAEAEWFERSQMPAHDDGISLTREMMGVFERGENDR